MRFDNILKAVCRAKKSYPKIIESKVFVFDPGTKILDKGF